MVKSFPIFSSLVAVGLVHAVAGVAAAQEKAPAPPAETRPAPTPAPPQDRPDAASRAGQRGQDVDPAKRPPRSLKMFVAEFRAVDLDKKTVTFQTDDGKLHTVEAQVPGRPEGVERAAQLAEILKPGDRIRMLCRINAKEEPTLVLSLHMIGDAAPMRFR